MGCCVVYGKREDEVEIYTRVDWDVRELDALELCAYVLSKEVGGFMNMKATGRWGECERGIFLKPLET